MNRTSGSGAQRRRYGVFLLVTGAIALGLSVISVTVGMRITEVLHVLTGDANRYVVFVVESLRLPRLVSAAVTGTALGVSGAIFQGLTRNQLASPDIIGVTAGASPERAVSAWE